MVVERGDSFGPDEINVGQWAWPGSTTPETLRIKPIGIKVSIEVVVSRLPSFEAEENDQYESEDANGTSDDTASDGTHI